MTATPYRLTGGHDLGPVETTWASYRVACACGAAWATSSRNGLTHSTRAHRRSVRAALAALDDLAASLTAYPTFTGLVTAPGAWRPTVDVSTRDGRRLANAYDEEQAARGDSRRAYRRTAAAC